MTVRLLVKKMGIDEYGAWVTMTSILGWMMLFDFGIGYGLKNRLSEAYATQSMQAIRGLISSVLSFYFITSFLLFLIFIFFSCFVSPFDSRFDVAILLVCASAVTFFCSFGSVILQGIGSFKKLSLINLILPISWFAYVFFICGDLISLRIASWFYFLFVLLQGGVLFFLASKEISPVFFRFKIEISPELKLVLKSSFGFFLLQISSLALFMSGNFIVFQSMGSKQAAAYDVMNKFFQLFNVGFSILITIAWTEISKAKAVCDVRKKRLILRVLIISSVFIGLLSVGMAIYISDLIHLLFSSEMTVFVKDALAFSLLVTVQSLAYSGAVFMNAYEKLKPQIILAILSIPVFVGAVFFFLRMDVGVMAVPLSSAIAILPSMFFCIFYGYRLARSPI